MFIKPCLIALIICLFSLCAAYLIVCTHTYNYHFEMQIELLRITFLIFQAANTPFL